MQIDFVVPQGLLDHEQIEGIEFAQVLNLVQRVGRIRVQLRTISAQRARIVSRTFKSIPA